MLSFFDFDLTLKRIQPFENRLRCALLSNLLMFVMLFVNVNFK